VYCRFLVATDGEPEALEALRIAGGIAHRWGTEQLKGSRIEVFAVQAARF
jgi:hypothetical protein